MTYYWNKSIYLPILFIAFIALAGGVTACQPTPTVLKVALVAPFEGAEREIGYDAIYAARLAVREINQAGGVNGYHVALVSLDDSGQPELATAVARSLVLDEQVIAVIGHGRPKTTTAAHPIYTEANLALLPIDATDPNTRSAEFHQAYEAVTPFDEKAGVYAGSTYDALQLVFAGIAAQDAPTRNQIYSFIQAQTSETP